MRCYILILYYTLLLNICVSYLWDVKVLTVYKSPFQKIRLGKNNDGGYIIANVPNVNYTLLLSGGILNDNSFENDFLNKYQQTKCYAFDKNVKELPNKNDNITFLTKNIGGENNNNLHHLINKYDNIFVKMDIEGGEITWINSLNITHLNKMNQLVIEFHFPFTRKELLVFKKINKSHALIHFHGNNCIDVNTTLQHDYSKNNKKNNTNIEINNNTNNKYIQVPNIFECTYLHKKFFTSKPELNVEKIPSNIDMKNCVNRNEISIDYPPFVN